MSVHFLHTSDWHLGQLFYNYSREHEHSQFLDWLLQQIQEKQPNALLISGDIFDVINPSAHAQKQLYQFIAQAHALAPHMQTLMIAGNHDSGYRIEQVAPLLEKYNAKTVGVVQWNTDKTLNTDHLILPIYNVYGETVAWCVALPFLRSAEITGFNEHTKDSESATEYLHHTVIAQALERKQPDQALIVMSHAHMRGGEASDSERSIIIGHQDALPIGLFGNDVDYVALGHLHKPQKVQHEHIRYSGSPIPLSFSEKNYKHQVVDVQIDKTSSEPFKVEKLHIPRTLELYPISGELSEVMQQLKALPTGEIANIDHRPYVDVEYFTHAPPPLDLRQQIEQALPPNRYRLTRICRKHMVQNNDTTASKIDLEPPTPTALFQELWKNMGYIADSQVEQDFLSLVEEAHTRQSEQK